MEDIESRQFMVLMTGHSRSDAIDLGQSVNGRMFYIDPIGIRDCHEYVYRNLTLRNRKPRRKKKDK
jgi:hypothetical protein